MWHMGTGWGWWMLFGWVWSIGLLVAIIWAVAALTRGWQDRGERRDTRAEPGALEILERRYARGELSHEEFEAMRRRLTGGPQA